MGPTGLWRGNSLDRVSVWLAYATKSIKAFLKKRIHIAVCRTINWAYYITAEKNAIQTFKNHFISGLPSTDMYLPLRLRDYLPNQATITLDMLRTPRIDPSQSGLEHTPLWHHHEYMQWYTLIQILKLCEDQENWTDGTVIWQFMYAQDRRAMRISWLCGIFPTALYHTNIHAQNIRNCSKWWANGIHYWPGQKRLYVEGQGDGNIWPFGL